MFPGEFTPENQLKLKSEAEKEKSKLDPWKLKHFEPIWGDSGQSNNVKLDTDDTKVQHALQQNAKEDEISSAESVKSETIDTPAVANNYTTSSGRLVKSPISYSSSAYGSAQKRQRNVGAVTRSSTVTTGSSTNDSPTKVISEKSFHWSSFLLHFSDPIQPIKNRIQPNQI